MKLKYFFLVNILLFTFFSYSQNLTLKQKNEVANLSALLEKYENEGNKNQIANNLKKIGDIYNQAYMPNDAIPFYVRACEISEEIGNTTAYRIISNQIGISYIEIENYAEAEKYLKISLDIAYQSNNQEIISSVLSNYASSLNHQKKYEQAIESYDEALKIAQELKNFRMARNAALKIAKCYKELGDDTNYEKYFLLTSSFNDIDKEQTIKEKELLVERQKQITLSKTYELKFQGLTLKLVADSLEEQEAENLQKQIEIELLNQKDVAKTSKILEEKAKVREKEAELKAKKTVIYSLIGGFIFVLLASLIVLKLFFDKKKANKKLKELNNKLFEKNEKINHQNDELQIKNVKINHQNEELQTKNEKINNQNEELQIKNIKIEKNRDELKKKNKQITASINYASRIQKAIFPSKRAILSDFKEAFIFYKPRDIVSGDFYWYAKHGDFKFVAAVDCTGHSVPGAFMSMIGNTLLNKIINEEKEFTPSKILHKLDNGIVSTLSSYTNTIKSNNLSDNINQPSDGMDMTLCRFNETKNEAVVTTANHEVIMISNEKLEVLSGGYFSIGGHIRTFGKKTFEEHTINYKEGTTFYMYSDGYPDQFGGPRGRKFMTKNFLKLLKKSQSLSLKEQEKKLSKNLIKWMGKIKQVDDILVIGIKF